MPRRISEEEFLQLARDKFGDKFKYGKYDRFCKEIEIECPIHGKFYDTPQHHLGTKTGCGKCGKIAMAKTQSMGLEEFIKRARKVHKNKYDYSRFEYTTNKTKSIIICPKHGEFLQCPQKHLYGQGCPKCKTERNHTPEVIAKQREAKRRNGTFNTSNSEKYIYKKLCEKFSSDDIIKEYTSEEYPFRCDFYIKSLDLYFEYNEHPTHNDHFFDETNEEDLKWLDHCKNNPKNWVEESQVYIWAGRDVEKRKIAEKNNLNYLVLWNLKEFDSWIEKFK